MAHLRPLALAALAGALAAPAAVALAGDPPSPAAPAPPPAPLPCVLEPAPSPAATPPSRTLLGAFGVLRRAPEAGDALPERALRALRSRGLEPADRASARLLRTTAQGGRAWVVPVADADRGLQPPACAAPPVVRRAPRESPTTPPGEPGPLPTTPVPPPSAVPAPLPPRQGGPPRTVPVEPAPAPSTPPRPRSESPNPAPRTTPAPAIPAPGPESPTPAVPDAEAAPTPPPATTPRPAPARPAPGPPVRVAPREPREGLAVVALDGAPAGGGGARVDLVRGRAPVAVEPCGPDGLVAISGIVPDGVGAAFLVGRDGSAVRADVRDNGFAFLVRPDRRRRWVVWTDARGVPRVQPLSLPTARCPRRALPRAGGPPRVTPAPACPRPRVPGTRRLPTPSCAVVLSP